MARLGIGLGVTPRGVPIPLLENPLCCIDVFLPGVGILGARFGLFLTGDSGRDSEGLIVRPPGPTDWENFGIGGVGELPPSPLKVAP